jgi:hypothetical protein
MRATVIGLGERVAAHVHSVSNRPRIAGLCRPERVSVRADLLGPTSRH